MWKVHILFICSSVVGHVGHFHLSVVVNNAAMNIYAYVFAGVLFSILFNIHLGTSLLDHMGILFLAFRGVSRLLSTSAANPTSNNA